MDIEQIIRQYIDKTVHMSLATVSGDMPWVCEVHFGYDDNLNLYFVSKTSTRHCTEIATNPHVAGNIVKQHPLDESPHGVYFEGKAQLIDNPSDEALDAYCTRLGRSKEDLIPQLTEENGSRLYEIRVNNWAAFGKFGQDVNKKYELKWN